MSSRSFSDDEIGTMVTKRTVGASQTRFTRSRSLTKADRHPENSLCVAVIGLEEKFWRLPPDRQPPPALLDFDGAESKPHRQILIV